MPVSLSVDQVQFAGYVAGAGTTHTELVSFKEDPAARTYKTPKPGGGSNMFRAEPDETTYAIELEVWAATAAALETEWLLIRAAFTAGLDEPLYFRLNGQSTTSYVMAHVERPPTMLHDLASDVGHRRTFVVVLVANDPTIYAA